GIQIGGLSGDRKVNLINNVICKNKSGLGGGLYAVTANVFLSGTSIFENIATLGGGVGFEDVTTGSWSLTFDPVNRCSIYNNYAAAGTDIYTVNSAHTAVVVDTFTVAKPWNFYANAYAYLHNQINTFSFDILNTIGHQEINQDLYVAPWGSDENSGTSAHDPFQTVFKAMYMIASDIDDPKTVHLAEGVYSPSLNNQMFPFPVKSNTSLVGASEDLTILDGEGNTTILLSPPHNENMSVSNLSLRNAEAALIAIYASNISFKNLKIYNLYSDRIAETITLSESTDINLENISIDNVSGGESATVMGIAALCCKGLMNLDNIRINNVRSDFASRANLISLNAGFSGTVNINRLSITNCSSNSADEYAFNSVLQIHPRPQAQRLKVNINNSLFADNYQANSGEKMMNVRAINDTVTIQNCTFTGNSGGSNILSVIETAYLNNNIFWNPEMDLEILLLFLENGQITDLHLAYNNIRGGSAGVVNQSPYNTVTWGEGNVNIDPMFRNQTEHPYSLLAESPMIDMGSPDADALDLGCLDIGGNERFWDGDADDIARIDIGAYEYQNIPIPVSLSAKVGENSVALSWVMPGILRALSGFRVYRNGDLRAELSDPAQRQYTDAIDKSGYYSYYITAMYGLLESDPGDEVLCYIEVVDTEDLLNPPDQFSMLLSPNPFYGHTTLRYFVPKAGLVKIDIYNLKGQLVKSLVNEAKRHGKHEAIWDGCDQAGNRVSGGLYFARLQANGRSLKSKVIKLK
ncbi:MAG: FlgD immunoglobulin-like domain containing protein, partial [Candidatus Cloacimonetes bacterium]|nr:FlgD immunoglobulin-like domain containing protein [Candidatus Cloacimonadota bacterium]